MASVDRIRVDWHDCDNGDQKNWIKQSLPKWFVCLNSDQALRLLCLKGYVGARDLTLWRHCWQEASEFLHTKTLLGGSWATKKIAPKTWKCSFRRATHVTVSKFRGSAQFFETVLRAILIYSLIQINSVPKILKTCFLHCTLAYHWRVIDSSIFDPPLNHCYSIVNLLLIWLVLTHVYKFGWDSSQNLTSLNPWL